MRRVVGRGVGHGNVTREVDDELAFHIEMRTRKLIEQGRSPDEARAEALRHFGDVDVVRRALVNLDNERNRAMNRANWFGELRQDLLYAIRMLRRNVGVTTVVAFTLALGIGANTAIFTLVNAVLLRPLPVRAPEELIAIGDPTRVGSVSHSSSVRLDIVGWEFYKQLRERNTQLTGLLASGRGDRIEVLPDSGRGEPDRPRTRFVSGNYFSVLGVPALRGRTFDGTEDASVGSAPVVVISHGYWTRHFNQDPSAIGRDIVINGARFTVIGVTPEWFTGEIVGVSNDLWLPLTMQPVVMPNHPWLNEKDAYWLLLLGRRKPTVSFEQARAGLEMLVRQIAVEQSADAARASRVDDRDIYISSGDKGFSRVRETYGAALVILTVGVALLIFIICANVANLLLARAVARGREMSVRLALGAGRRRLVRQLLTESLVLGLIGAVSGLLVSRWGSQLLLWLAADGTSAIPLDVALDLPALLFTLGLSVLTVVLFGLVPALRASRLDVAAALRASAKSVSGAFGARPGRFPLGRVMIASQVALSLVLLIGAALLVRSLRSVEGVNTGLDRDHLLIVDVDPMSRGYEKERLRVMARQLSEQLARVPGVAAVTYSENGIFSGTEGGLNIQVPGFTAQSQDDSIAAYDAIGPAYVQSIGGRLVAGRDFTPADAEGTAPIVLVNESFAKHYFGTASAIGRTVQVDDTLPAQIVGVVADVKDHELRDEGTRRFYVAIQQGVFDVGSLTFTVRTRGDPSALAAQVRQTIVAFDPLLHIDDVSALTTLMRRSVSGERLLARIATGFGFLALVLAAVGLYGVMTYAITRRTSEIGLRVALGARRTNVIGMVLGDALKLVGAGVVVGVPLALASTRFLRSQLFGVAATDPASIGVALAVLLVSGLVAALVPALRASRVAPQIALRQD